MFGEGKQSDVFVVYDVLRVLEAIVGTQEVIDGRHMSTTKLADHNDIEHLGRTFIVVQQASFTQLPSCTVEQPVDTLDCDEHQPQQLVEKSRHKTLDQQPVARQS